MAYIGRQPTIGNFQICDAISVVNGQAAYTMQVGGVNVNPQSANHMIVSLNGTIQKPNSSYTVANSVITFSSNLATGDVIDFIQILGDVLDLGVPSDGTVTTAKLADNNITTAKLAYNPNPNRNIIINGDMSIAQRGTSATSLGHAQYNSIDRWSQNLTASTMAFTGEQSTDAPDGFDYSYKISCTTAEASLSASSRMMPLTRVEDSNLGYLKFGTSSAVDLTMSFYVKSNKTGTYQINLWHNNVSGYISGTYAISSANTWEKKTIVFKGDQGTAMGNDSGIALQLEFVLAGGSNYTGGTFVPNTTTTYPSYVANTRAANQGVNLADSTSNTWQITGLQLEVGSTASDFEFLPVDVQTQRCERYYETSMSYGDYSQYQGQQPVAGMASSTYGATVSTAGGRQFRTWKRAAPTVTLYHQDGTSGGIYRIHDAQKTTGNVAVHINQNGFLFASKTSAFNSGFYYYYGITADAEL